MSNRQDHIVKSYDSELERLQGEILHMGELAITQLESAIRALKEGDEQLAKRVIAADERIDAMELEVSSDVVRLLALRAPMATDLRVVLASLRIAADIERIGDYAANMAKRSLAFAGARLQAPVPAVAGMVTYAIKMMRDVLEAYRRRDAERAMAVRASDLEMDRRYNGVFRELLTYMLEDPRNISTCTHFLFIAKNIERIGDHITNIAENIAFQVEGKLPSEERAKGENTNIPPEA